MILVTEAGYQGIVAFSACSTLPVSASTTSSASACAARGAIATASAATSKIRFNDAMTKQQAKKNALMPIPVL